MNMAQCLCKGCIDKITGKEDMSLVSEVITTSITVLRKKSKETSFEDCNKNTCGKKTFDIPVACHCSLPSYTGS